LQVLLPRPGHHAFPNLYLFCRPRHGPDGRAAAVLKIAGTERRLADGEYLLWDDTFPHEVTNDSDEVRTVLLLDVWRRGMPFDMRLLSRLLIFIVHVMARLRGVVTS
jgi:aspartate beta-hydroxylase